MKYHANSADRYSICTECNLHVIQLSGSVYTEAFLYSDVLVKRKALPFRMFVWKHFFVDTEMVKVLFWFSKKMATRNPETLRDQTVQGKEQTAKA